MTAALYHTVNHAAFKALLFLGAGAVVHATGTQNMEAMGGLVKRMPWTAACFFVGSASIAALPPFNGFVSEWLTFVALFQNRHLAAVGLNLVFILGIASLALTGGLAMACFVKAFGITFLALPRSEAAASRRRGARGDARGHGRRSRRRASASGSDRRSSFPCSAPSRRPFSVEPPRRSPWATG